MSLGFRRSYLARFADSEHAPDCILPPVHVALVMNTAGTVKSLRTGLIALLGKK